MISSHSKPPRDQRRSCSPVRLLAVMICFLYSAYILQLTQFFVPHNNREVMPDGWARCEFGVDVICSDDLDVSPPTLDGWPSYVWFHTAVFRIRERHGSDLACAEYGGWLYTPGQPIGFNRLLDGMDPNIEKELIMSSRIRLSGGVWIYVTSRCGNIGLGALFTCIVSCPMFCFATWCYDIPTATLYTHTRDGSDFSVSHEKWHRMRHLLSNSDTNCNEYSDGLWPRVSNDYGNNVYSNMCKQGHIMQLCLEVLSINWYVDYGGVPLWYLVLLYPYLPLHSCLCFYDEALVPMLCIWPLCTCSMTTSLFYILQMVNMSRQDDRIHSRNSARLPQSPMQIAAHKASVATTSLRYRPIGTTIFTRISYKNSDVCYIFDYKGDTVTPSMDLPPCWPCDAPNRTWCPRAWKPVVYKSNYPVLIFTLMCMRGDWSMSHKNLCVSQSCNTRCLLYLSEHPLSRYVYSMYVTLYTAFVTNIVTNVNIRCPDYCVMLNLSLVLSFSSQENLWCYYIGELAYCSCGVWTFCCMYTPNQYGNTANVNNSCMRLYPTAPKDGR